LIVTNKIGIIIGERLICSNGVGVRVLENEVFSDIDMVVEEVYGLVVSLPSL
jgi:ABC-type nitrate/sulfonate/bicarbonate transport system permease component